MLRRCRTLPSRIHHSAIEERQDIKHYLQVLVQPKAHPETEATTNIQDNYSKSFDDDVSLKRKRSTFWTAMLHIITAVIGSGVLSLAWAMGKLGWVAGPAVMVLFAFVILYTSNLLSQCCRSGEPVTGHRNYTYVDAVKANLGRRKVTVCWTIQNLILFGVAIGHTIAASDSMSVIRRSNCFHKHGKESRCNMSSNGYMITFGIIEALLSQIPDFDQVWWLSIVPVITSLTYSTVGIALSVAKVVENRSLKGSLAGINIGRVTDTQKLWGSLQALGAIAFAYSNSIILIEIQDTLKSPPAEYKIMKKATSWCITVTTAFHLLCGCMGYAAFGDLAPGNLLTGFGFYNPYWLLDIASIAIVVHLIGEYQVYSQRLFAYVEKWSARKWPQSNFVGAEYGISIPYYGIYQMNFFRLVWRIIFVVFTTFIAILVPFFEDVVGMIGAIGFWPLTIYFPVEMYISQKKIGPWTSNWVGLQILSVTCLFVSIAAAVGALNGIILDLKVI